MQKNKKMIFALYVFFFISGAAGLVYETLWTRMLSVTFGHTVFAVSAILSAFMGGLAAGSFIAGRYIDGLDSPGRIKGIFSKILTTKSYSPSVRIYGILEIVIGLYALLTPSIIGLVNNAYTSVMSKYSLSLYPVSLFCFLLSIITFIIPTTAMGATLPIISRFIIRTYKEIMEKTAKIYAVNTFGAVLGVFLTGFILFPLIGLKVTLVSTAFVNVLVGVVAILLDISFSEAKSASREKSVSEIKEMEPEDSGNDEEKNETATVSPETVQDNKIRYALILGVFFISGFTSMVYEVAWTRAIALSIGSSTYSFAIILTSFLFGIALGSWIYSHSGLFRQDKVSILSLANLELTLGALGLIIIPILGILPFIFLRIFPHLKSSFFLIMGGNLFICFLIVILPAILYGASFPMVVAIYTKDLKKLGRSIGNVYASNTTGNILGSFLAGFVLIPVVGAENTLKTAVVLNVLAALAIYFYKFKSIKKRFTYGVKFLLSILIIISVFAFNFWKSSAMSMGVAVYADNYSNVKTLTDYNRLTDHLKQRIEYFKDGISCTVTVTRAGDQIALKVNGKTDASWMPDGSGDFSTQWLLGFIPMTIHPNPEKVCIIGFGSGITVASADRFSEVKRIDCVEIEPAVLEAGKFFKEGNHDVLNSPRVKYHIADGRNFVLASKEKFDVIISEPSNPWIAGIGNLFSKDFYEICYDKISDDGVCAQWLHTYSMAPEDVKMILNTFYSVFPNGDMWYTYYGDLLLIGRKSDKPLDYERLKLVIERDKVTKDSLKLIGIDEPYEVLGHHLINNKEIRRFSAGGKLNTDDLPLLEFNAPKNLYTQRSQLEIINEMLTYSSAPYGKVKGLDSSVINSPVFYVNLGLRHLKYHHWGYSKQLNKKALKLDPEFYEALFNTAYCDMREEKYLKAYLQLQHLVTIHPDRKDAWQYLIQMLTTRELYETALLETDKALTIFPDDPEFQDKAYSLAVRLEKWQEAISYAENILKRAPDNAAYKSNLARLYIRTNQPDKSRQLYLEVVESGKAGRAEYLGLGDVASTSGNLEEAAKYYAMAAAAAPKDPLPLIKLALTYEKAGKFEEAADVCRKLLEEVSADNREAAEILLRLEKKKLQQ